ncbi:MAG TPA: hypothetical protein VI756_19375 [Blastocatellia bacterium]
MKSKTLETFDSSVFHLVAADQELSMIGGQTHLITTHGTFSSSGGDFAADIVNDP